MIRIYHNSRCSKSRAAIQYCEERNLEFETIFYLENPPTFEELHNLIKKLDISAVDLIRKNEAIFKEEFKELELSEMEWILLMCEHPILIERPIVELEDRAIIARPTEVLEDFFA